MFVLEEPILVQYRSFSIKWRTKRRVSRTEGRRQLGGVVGIACECYLLRRILVYQPKDLNRDWSPRFSTLRDKTAGFEPKRPEI